MDNPIQIRAVVADEVEGILIGMPGLEQCGIDIVSSKGQVHFRNGAILDYKTGKEVNKSRASHTSQKGTITVQPDLAFRRITLPSHPVK